MLVSLVEVFPFLTASVGGNWYVGYIVMMYSTTMLTAWCIRWCRVRLTCTF
ncbi:hypothetical protein PtrM4_126190 [Pyrenophora tritici-repentis]|uniref:Uncharacterized protein n=1 Tax=Pyrenophora tritici-repentis TaxID=45151 RepID=A0A834RQQ3_9PLEO|nr:hypothetical protein PtrM4_126190 [Pyrenophora tritici-repentis]